VNNRAGARVRADAEGNVIAVGDKSQPQAHRFGPIASTLRLVGSKPKKSTRTAAGLYNLSVAGNRKGETVTLMTTSAQVLALRFRP
jgi:hypothetical protein